MANIDNGTGFLPYNNPNNGGGQPVVEEFDLAAANTKIGVGTPVKSVGGVVDIAAAGDALIGIAAEYKAANAGGKIKVWSDPSQRFVAQTDNGTGVLTAVAGIQLNANFIGTGVTNKRSTAEIDESSGATGATLPFKVLKLSPEVSNAYGEFNRLIVKINNHQLGSHTGTAGT